MVMEFPESILEFDSHQINSSQMKRFIEVNNKRSIIILLEILFKTCLCQKSIIKMNPELR